MSDPLRARVEALLTKAEAMLTSSLRAELDLAVVRDLVAEVTRLQAENETYRGIARTGIGMDYKRRAEAADAALREAQAHLRPYWHNIDTAPTDGTRVVFWYPRAGVFFSGVGDGSNYKHGPDGEAATHWMLPIPPSIHPWQPIETAGPTAKSILLTDGWIVGEGYLVGPSRETRWCHAAHNIPKVPAATHWMPLPLPPTPDAAPGSTETP